jgi:hypothetical protein
MRAINSASVPTRHVSRHGCRHERAEKAVAARSDQTTATTRGTCRHGARLIAANDSHAVRAALGEIPDARDALVPKPAEAL